MDSFYFSEPTMLMTFSTCNNKLFKINNEIIKIGIFNNFSPQVCDFFEDNTHNFLSLDSFNTLHNTSLNLLLYNQLKSAILAGCRKLGIRINVSQAQCRPRYSSLLCIINKQTKGCKKYYNLLENKTVQHFNTSMQEKKWHKELNTIISVDTWNRYWQLCANIKYDNKTKWHQYQILRHSLKTHNIVSHFAAATTNTCPFCEDKNTPDTISHHIYNCKFSFNLWKSLKNYIEEIGGNDFFTKNNIIFGVKNECANSFSNHKHEQIKT